MFTSESEVTKYLLASLQSHFVAFQSGIFRPKCRDSRLRQPRDLELHRPVPNKAIGAAAFGYVGPDRWNKPPERLRGSASLNIFKRDLKTHLFINTF